MGWEQDEGLLCKLISDNRIGHQIDGTAYKEFQGFVSALQEFERVGLVTNVNPHHESSTASSFIDAVFWLNPPAIVSGRITVPQRRWLLLSFFSAKSQENQSEFFLPKPESFSGLAGNARRIQITGEWLSRHKFITTIPNYDGLTGQITDVGQEALEHGLEMLTDRQTPAMNHYDQRNLSINVATLNAGSGDLAIGQGATINKQVLADELAKLIEAIQQGSGSPEEKASVISRIKGALAHPLVTAVAGGIAGAIGG